MLSFDKYQWAHKWTKLPTFKRFYFIINTLQYGPYKRKLLKLDGFSFKTNRTNDHTLVLRIVSSQWMKISNCILLLRHWKCSSVQCEERRCKVAWFAAKETFHLVNIFTSSYAVHNPSRLRPREFGYGRFRPRSACSLPSPPAHRRVAMWPGAGALGRDGCILPNCRYSCRQTGMTLRCGQMRSIAVNYYAVSPPLCDLIRRFTVRFTSVWNCRISSTVPL